METFAGIEWDDGNRTKCQKHGVSIVEIDALFLSDPFVGRDERHSEQEDRYVAVGKTSTGRARCWLCTPCACATAWSGFGL